MVSNLKEKQKYGEVEKAFDIEEKKDEHGHLGSDGEADKIKYNFEESEAGLEDLKDVKWLLTADQKIKHTLGIAFNTSILKIALNRAEEKIAQILVFLYAVDIKEEMIIRAVKTNM